MGNLRATEIKAFVPSRDFALSQRFYRALGFTMASEGGGVAYFHFGHVSFLLQDFCADGLAENFMMHLLVEDVEAWWQHVRSTGVVSTFKVRCTDIEVQPWGMKDFCLTDPSGVLWRIGQNTDPARPATSSDGTGSRLRIEPDDPARPDVLALLDEHLRNMHELSPPESVHALDVSGLQRPEITFWSVRSEGVLLGCGALKELDATHGEVKSMRTPQTLRRRGAGRAVLVHIIDEARRRGYTRLSLETGSMEAFRPAWRLYESVGFTYCGPFADYTPDPNSVFMTLTL